MTKHAPRDTQKGLEMHTHYWEWHYDQQEQVICDLISEAFALKEKMAEVQASLMKEYENRARMGAQREGVAIRLKVHSESNRHFGLYKPKAFVMKRKVMFQ